MVTRRKKRKSKTLKRKRKKSNHFIIRARRNKTFRGGEIFPHWLFDSPRRGVGYEGMRDINNDLTTPRNSPRNVMRIRNADKERADDELRKFKIESRYTSNPDLKKQEDIVEKVKEIMDESRIIISKLEELLGNSGFVSNQNVTITHYNELIRTKDSLNGLQSNKPKTRLSKIRTYFVGNDIDDRLIANTLQLDNLKQKIQYFYNYNFKIFHKLLQSLNKYFQDNVIDNRSLFWILLQLTNLDSDLYMNLTEQNKSISARITYKDFIIRLLTIATKIENMFNSKFYSLHLNESNKSMVLQEYNFNNKSQLLQNQKVIKEVVSPMFSKFLKLFDYYNNLYSILNDNLTTETTFILPPYDVDNLSVGGYR